MTSGIATIDCYGGPLDGRKASVFGNARFLWYVEGQTVSNTDATEYRDVKWAEGVYVRMTRKLPRGATEEILYWRPVPGAVPKEQ